MVLYRRILMRTLLGGSLLLVLAACAESPVVVVEEHAPPDGVASVAGQVLDASGTPIVATVTIICAGGAFGEMATTDAQGHYLANLATSASVLGGTSGRVSCRFSAGGIHADASIGFGPPGLPHVLQIVNLRAS
jgi:hypothetical protein